MATTSVAMRYVPSHEDTAHFEACTTTDVRMTTLYIQTGCRIWKFALVLAPIVLMSLAVFQLLSDEASVFGLNLLC